MKASFAASALFASLALAAPLDRRVLVTKTNTVVETVVVYTTVWDDPAAPATDVAAVPTTTAAQFFEQPSSAAAVATTEAAEPSPSSTTVEVAPTPEPVVSSPAAEAVVPSSTVEAVVESPTPTPEVTPTPTPEPVASTPVEAAPSSTVASEPAASQPATGGSGSGETYTGSLTMNYYSGGNGACGQPIQDTDMVAALAVAGFGDSTYDSQTGNPTNPWCGKKVSITYNGKTADATIMDRCPGCTGTGGLDATPALWEALTGGLGGASGDRLESGMTFQVIG